MPSKPTQCPRVTDRRLPSGAIAALLTALFASLLWAYWSKLVVMANKWSASADYQHGYLVPVIALVMLWLRFDLLGMGVPRPKWPLAVGLIVAAGTAAGLGTVIFEDFFQRFGWLPVGLTLSAACLVLWPSEPQPEKFRPNWWGLPILVSGIALRWVGAHYYFEWFDFLSLLPCVLGLALLLGGWHLLRWAWPAILFLGFMIPLPYTLEVALRGPLRRIGTEVSTYVMQTIGLPALSEGNLIVVGEHPPIGVDEVCSGLRMLMIFFALSAAVAVLVERPLWQRIVVLASAIPIALVSNITRITVTGLLHVLLGNHMFHLAMGDWVLIHRTGHEFVDKIFHEWAGWMMMVFALGLLWVEMRFLSRLFVVEEEHPLAVGLSPDQSEPSLESRRAEAPVPQ